MARTLPRARTGTRSRPPVSTPGLTVTQELVDSFYDHLREQGRTEDTIYTYRGHLTRMLERLDEDQTIYRGTLEQLGQQMVADGYSPNTVNVCFAALNSFLEFCGRRDLQVNKLEKVEEVQPEITRNEYHRILMTAKALGKDREYLLIKVLATTGINISDLAKVTVKAVQEGSVVVDGQRGTKLRRPLATGLQKELLAYCTRRGILDGPVFLSRNGKPMERSNVNARISALAHDARVDVEKCNPRCLQRLYKETMDGIRENMEVLVQQMYMQTLDREQLEIGWAEE